MAVVLTFATLIGLANDRSATMATSKQMPFKAGGTFYIIAEFQNVVVKIAPRTDIKIDIRMEITAFDPKYRLQAYVPTFVEYGQREYVFVNDVKHRAEPDKEWDPNALPNVLVGGEATPGYYGTVTVDMPPGMNLWVVTSSGRCTLNGDLGNNCARFQTDTGKISVKGAADDIDAHTNFEDVHIDLTRTVKTLQVTMDKGGLSIAGVAQNIKVQANSANVNMLIPSDLILAGTLRTESGKVSSEVLPAKKEGDQLFDYENENADSHLDISTRSGNIAVKVAPYAFHHNP
jgi:hypothetical protein